MDQWSIWLSSCTTSHAHSLLNIHLELQLKLESLEKAFKNAKSSIGTIDYAQSKELANYRKAAEKKKADAKYAKSLATARRVKAKMKEKERLEKEKKAKEKKEKVAKKAKEMREKFKKKPAKKI